MQERFQELVRDGILALPQDMKAVLRVVEDPEVDDESRVAAAGALLHVLSGSNSIPGMRGILGYVDDVLVLRLVLDRIARKNPGPMARHAEAAPELLGGLDAQLHVVRDYLGELAEVLEQAAASVDKLNHMGHTPERCARDTDDGNWLYDAVHEAIVERLEFDEDEVAREVKGVSAILPHLRTRLAATR